MFFTHKEFSMLYTLRISILVLVTFVVTGALRAQSPAHFPGEILVQLSAGTEKKTTLDYIHQEAGILPEFRIAECISADMHIWLCTFRPEAISENEMLRIVRSAPGIRIAQFNHILSERIIPDDPFFSQQWHLQDAEDNDIDADLAWDITTGGTTVNGDEIVVCVVELDGAKWDVAEIAENHWTNADEIESNGLDDDGNGYVDDYHGWNSAMNNDDIDPGDHGTRVSSMIGARGNNGAGISGVNWDVQLMQVEIGGISEANAIAGYSYPLKMRKLYNQSGGSQGAFVVATNSSWGTNFGQPADAPLWCAMYDTLGVYGILSCGSTTNSNVDVDAMGDLPTACPSDYLVSVGRTNSQDIRSSGGYGLTTIDLMAPGDAVYLANNSGYATTTGTSFSSPCVAGAIALLYAAPCNSFMQMVNYSPAEAAALVKQYILNGVDQTSQLLDETVSGGRLNVRNSLDLLLENCDNNSCIAPFGLSAQQLDGSLDYLLGWDLLPGMDSFSIRYRSESSAEWTTLNNISENQFLASALDACSLYEFQVRASCDADSSNWTNSFQWTTDGCCINPAEMSVISTDTNSANITWDDVLAAESYTIIATDAEGNALNFEGIQTIPYTLGGLNPCTEYTLTIASNCPDNTDETQDFIVHTSGCDECTDLQYCSVIADSDAEHIALVQVGDINRSSGSDNGYVLVEDQTTILHAGSTYTMTCAPGYQGSAYNENFRAWIDYNSDGFLNEATELVFDSPNPGTTSVSQSFTVPASIAPGVVRLRVAMIYSPPSSPQEPSPCGQWQYGEIEDYCVLLDPTVSVEEVNSSAISIYPNPAADYLRIALSPDLTTKRSFYEIMNIHGAVVSQGFFSQSEAIDIRDLPSGTYAIRVRGNARFFSAIFIRE